MTTPTIAEVLRAKISQYETHDSLNQLAKDTNITYGVLWRFNTRPDYSPTLRIIEKLAQYFNLVLTESSR